MTSPPDIRIAETEPRPTAGADGYLDLPQIARISADANYLLERLIAKQSAIPALRALLVDERAWWAEQRGESILRAVRRSFGLRQLCLRAADSDGSWRNSLSYIGDLDPADDVVCSYDYDRAEVRLPTSSPLATPYRWSGTQNLPATTWYARTGMSAITAWLIAIARMAAQTGENHTVLTNKLYHETETLFDMARIQRVSVSTFADLTDLLAGAAEAKRATILLDSSRPDGSVAAVAQVLRAVDATRVGCVVWDNTCAPAEEHPFDDMLRLADLGVILILIRSHAKLDQLGLEFTALGSIVMLSGRSPTAEAVAWRDGITAYLPESLAVTGGCASPGVLRLLNALGLPNNEQALPANRLLRGANELGGEVLIGNLQPELNDRYLIEENDHRCFVEVHILQLPAPATFEGPNTWPPWDALDRVLTRMETAAADLELPIWKSASFGFHYTGLSWYSADEPPHPGGHQHTVLRVCFGMHDAHVTRQIAQVVADQLQAVRSWTEQ